jgi:hypothetical protein
MSQQLAAQRVLDLFNTGTSGFLSAEFSLTATLPFAFGAGNLEAVVTAGAVVSNPYTVTAFRPPMYTFPFATVGAVNFTATAALSLVPACLLS